MAETKKRPRTAAQIAAEKRHSAITRFVGLKLNTITDADILAKLESTDNMQGYIKTCIRADIAKSK